MHSIIPTFLSHQHVGQENRYSNLRWVLFSKLNGFFITEVKSAQRQT